MDVDTFIATYRGEWERLAALTARGSRGLAAMRGADIEDTVALYLRVSGHLAEARTRYNDPGLEAYLNQLVARAHAAVYSAEPRSFRSVVRAFGTSYRQALRRTAPFILIAAGVLAAGALAAALWATHSRDVQAGLFPPIARDAVRRANGPPQLGVPPSGLSAVILFNNVQVALVAFVAGIALGVPTLVIVAQNAAVLGALAGSYTAAGATGYFWSLILPHGLLELTAICISAGAGMRIGWSLVDPGERSRTEALAEEARDAVLVVTGVVPAFALAAAIEGFLTPSHVGGSIKIGVGVAVFVAYLALIAAPGRGHSRPAPLARRY